MNIHIIYCNNPDTRVSAAIDVVDVYDVGIQTETGKLVIHKKGMKPAITWPSSEEDLETLKLEWGHLVVDTRVFADWAVRMFEFSNAIRREACRDDSAAPFEDLLFAACYFHPCNNKKAKKISDDLARWESRAKQFGPQNFTGGYELIAKAFKKARRNGGVWIKHI